MGIEIWLGLEQTRSTAIEDQVWLSGGSLELTGNGPDGTDLEIDLNDEWQECSRLFTSESVISVYDWLCWSDVTVLCVSRCPKSGPHISSSSEVHSNDEWGQSERITYVLLLTPRRTFMSVMSMLYCQLVFQFPGKLICTKSA